MWGNQLDYGRLCYLFAMKAQLIPENIFIIFSELAIYWWAE